jgi:hypothetical protein
MRDWENLRFCWHWERRRRRTGGSGTSHQRSAERGRLTGDRQCSLSALALLVGPCRRSAVLVGYAPSAGSERKLGEGRCRSSRCEALGRWAAINGARRRLWRFCSTWTKIRGACGQRSVCWERDGVGRWAGRLGGRRSVSGRRSVHWTVERGRFGKWGEILDKFCLKAEPLVPCFLFYFFFFFFLKKK